MAISANRLKKPLNLLVKTNSTHHQTQLIIAAHNCHNEDLETKAHCHYSENLNVHRRTQLISAAHDCHNEDLETIAPMILLPK